MLPLYKLALDNNLGTTQYMDKETLEWISRESAIYDKNKIKIKLFIKPQQLILINKYIPSEKNFLKKHLYGSIHGIQHIIRVMVNTILITNILKKRNYTHHLITASIHDIRRQNDKDDPNHGKRAADWFIKNKSFFNISTHQEKKIYMACKFHDVGYYNIPNNILDKYKLDIDIIKAADALDRFRLPKKKWWPNKKFINITASHILIPYSRILTIKSEERILKGDEPVNAVLETAEQLFIKRYGK